jgi:hypothetical protein
VTSEGPSGSQHYARSEVVLIGPQRAGKSTIGGLLAARLGVPQVSLDMLRSGYYRELGFDEAAAAFHPQQHGEQNSKHDGEGDAGCGKEPAQHRRHTPTERLQSGEELRTFMPITEQRP